MSTTLDCKDIGIKKIRFCCKNSIPLATFFLYVHYVTKNFPDFSSYTDEFQNLILFIFEPP